MHIDVAGFEPNYQKIYTCLGQLLRGQPLPPLFPSGKSRGGGGGFAKCTMSATSYKILIY